jgi:hypothetical protein
MRKRRKAMTIEEWIAAREHDPKWLTTRERLKQEDRKRDAVETLLGQDERPLVADLRAAGFDVESSWDLFNRQEPYREDIPISSYAEAVPILIKHLDRPYHCRVREGIVRALTAKWGRVALRRLIEELRRTRDSGGDDKRRAVELILAGGANLYTRSEVEQLTEHHWESFRVAIANAIGYHFQKEHVPLIADLLRDPQHGDSCRMTLADYLRTKMRRWRRSDPEVLALLQELEGIRVGLRERHAEAQRALFGRGKGGEN